MAQQGLGSEHKIKCGHAGCSCLVEPSQSYCSDHCARVSQQTGSYNLPGGGQGEKGCQCGHPECEGKGK